MAENQTSNVKTLVRIVEFLKPFKSLIFLQIFLNIIFSALSTISVTLILPILKIIFYPESTAQNLSTKSLDPISSLNNSFMNFIKNLFSTAGSTYGLLINISIFIVLVFVLKNIFKYWGSLVSVKLEEGIIKSIRDTIFCKLTSLSVDFFSKNKQGNLMSIITNDVATINGTTISSFTSFVRETIQIFLFLSLLITISGKLTAIAFSTSILSFLLIRFAVQFLRKYASRMQTAMADYTSTLQETITGIRTIKAYTAEKFVNDKFTGETKKYVVSALKLKRIMELIPSINEVFAIFALCVVLFVGGSEVLHKSMTPENLMLFLFLLFSIMSPLGTVINSFSRFQHGFVAAERVFGIIDTVPNVKNGAKKIEKFNNCLEFKNVDFSYLDDSVIKDVSIKVEKSKRIAFVGPSGSGKSTALDLFIRFYDPNNGSVLIDGDDIKNYDLFEYRNLFGIVSQENMLFNDSIANNIRFGNSHASDEEIQTAAKLANAFDFISKLPNGFETVIGDRGITLSGGERQRLAIARALVRNPQILIFDEATSALDAESEKIVQEAINKSLEEKTAIIVAHRLATIIDADIIYVFDNGKVVEYGNHQQLIESNGLYRKLYDIQFKSSTN